MVCVEARLQAANASIYRHGLPATEPAREDVVEDGPLRTYALKLRLDDAAWSRVEVCDAENRSSRGLSSASAARLKATRLDSDGESGR